MKNVTDIEHYKQVAREIGEAHRDNGRASLGSGDSATSLVNASRALASFSHWSDCVDALGLAEAVEQARVGYRTSDTELEVEDWAS